MVAVLKSSCKSRIYHEQFSFKRHNVALVESDPTLFLSHSTLFWIALAPAREPHQKERLLFAHKNGDFGALFVNGAKLPRSNLEKAIVTNRIGFCATLLARVNEQVFILARSFFYVEMTLISHQVYRKGKPAIIRAHQSLQSQLLKYSSCFL